MKLPTFKRLNKNDYTAEFRELINKMSDSLNSGVENVYLALNKRLTRRENMLSTEKELAVTVDADGIPNAPLFFELDFEGKAFGLVVERVDNLSNTISYPTSGVFASFTQKGTTITIKHLTGLRAGINYQIRVVVNG